MRRAVVLVIVAGCGRIGFDPAGGIDITGDGALPVGRWRSVSVGDSSTCGITSNDELWCWGNGQYGGLGTGTTIIAQGPTKVGSGWSEVSVGGFHSCGVKKDGTLWCWGLNEYGGLGAGAIKAYVSSPQQVQTSGWAHVAVGESYSCGLKTIGELYCWGYNELGQVGDNTSIDQPTPVIVAGAWKAITAGRAHACGIRMDDSLWCWGDGMQGQLGNDTLAKKFFPVAVNANGKTWKAVSAAQVHTCAIEATTSEVWCWGENYSTMLGDGTYDQSAVPKRTTMKGTAVTTGHNTTCVLHTDGTASCVGSAGRADFGAAGDADVKVPTKIAVTGLVAIAAGGATTCAIDGEKHLFCVGANSYGQTGQPYGEVHDATEPTDARRDWIDIVASRRHTCARASDGTWCWGDGYAGQNGDGENYDRQVPKLAGSGFVALALGESTTVARKADNTLWAWGEYLDGSAEFSPTQIGVNGTAIAIGDVHGCALSTTTLRCGGTNEYGQVGDGTTMPRPSEVTIAGTWNGVWAGWLNTCATDMNNMLFCWGRGDSGELGNAGFSDSSSPSPTGLGLVKFVGIGANFMCALRTDGAIYCWGYGEDGQFGNGVPDSSNVPKRVGVRNDWTHLAVGDRHVCAIAGGALWCWGHGDEGQLGDPSLTQRNAPRQVGTDTNWIAVGAGDHFTCAVKSDGARYCFGANEDGQLGNDRTWQKIFLAVP